MILVRSFGFEVPKGVRGYNDRNFKSTALVCALDRACDRVAPHHARGFSVVVTKTVSLLFAAAAAFLVAGNGAASAQDTLKIAVPQRGAWDTSITEIGNRAGIFRKHGVNAELLFTGGGAEALGAIIGQSIDAAVSVGISTVLGSFSNGAPVRVFSAETTGQPDIYWFVPSQSPIRSVADFKDKTIGYSVSGSSSHAALLALLAPG